MPYTVVRNNTLVPANHNFKPLTAWLTCKSLQAEMASRSWKVLHPGNSYTLLLHDLDCHTVKHGPNHNLNELTHLRR